MEILNYKYFQKADLRDTPQYKLKPSVFASQNQRMSEENVEQNDSAITETARMKCLVKSEHLLELWRRKWNYNTRNVNNPWFCLL